MMGASITGNAALGADDPVVKMMLRIYHARNSAHSPVGAADDPPQPPGPTKPYNEAVNDVHRYLKEIVDRAPPEQMDGSVKEGVREDLDRAIARRDEQKPWPAGSLR